MNEIELQLSENIHYEIIPQVDNEQGWDVRLLEDYPETVIRFGNVKFEGEDENDDDGYLSFNFDIVSTPDGDLDVDNNLTFQQYCGRILSSIIEKSIVEGTLMAQDEKTGEVLAPEEMHEEIKELINEYQSGTDGTEELTD
jgi:hypothetical protein